ncbi:uncharacterized protein LOC109839524 isoform X1 [Asparagus officinalis]|uniref:uncharacterized protein LOC109839524 isoform X1 n=1 Tax=Asparagus officinalis TaxID=4686 RepID=UPI00098DE287|nr:uncharacterized protein LOC109839524 isoform X1 [Asparagus officinalis]
MMEDLVEGNITRRLPRIIEAVLKVVSASFQASIDKEVDLISKARAADATRIKNLSDGLGNLKSEVARRFDKLRTKDPEGLRARIEAMEEDSVVTKNHLEDLRRRVGKLEGDSKAETKNPGKEVENVKGRILEIGQLRAGLTENLAKETEQAPESTRRLQHDDGLTRKQASAFTEELRGSVVEVIQAAMDDFLRSSSLQDLKNSLEDTIERQIVRGIATIASQHSKFEVSLSQKFQGYVDAVWTTTNSLKSLLADFRSVLIPFFYFSKIFHFSSDFKSDYLVLFSKCTY